MTARCGRPKCRETLGEETTSRAPHSGDFTGLSYEHARPDSWVMRNAPTCSTHPSPWAYQISPQLHKTINEPNPTTTAINPSVKNPISLAQFQTRHYPLGWVRGHINVKQYCSQCRKIKSPTPACECQPVNDMS